jgi:hypothetical protein
MGTGPQRERQRTAFKDAGRKAERSKTASEAPWGGSHLFERELFPFADVDAAALADGIAATLAAGNAITLSLTADGGAVKVTLWVKGVKHVAYCANSDQLDIIMGALQQPPTDAESSTKAP